MSPEQKAEMVQKVIDKISREFKNIQDVLDSTAPSPLYYFIASLPSQRTFLNIIQSYIPSCFRSAATTSPTNDVADTKTVIWDSGSSMSITNDRSEFIDGEYQSAPANQTITGDKIRTGMTQSIPGTP